MLTTYLYSYTIILNIYINYIYKGTRMTNSELVKVTSEGIFCDSSMVAKKFGIGHNKVIGHIKTIIADLKNTGVDVSSSQKLYSVVEESRVYRGREFRCFLMNKEFFSLLCMRFKGKRAFNWQLKFVEAFFAMQKRVLSEDLNKSNDEWISARKESKMIRRQETDVIKDFVEYATNQGSKSAKFYYKHITNATYKALGLLAQKKPKLRDTLNIIETSELILTENKAKQLLKKYMDTGMSYKDIYTFVRDDLVEYADSIKDFKQLK